MPKIHPNVQAAVVAAIAAVFAATITTYGTIAVTKPQAQEVQANITSFSHSYTGLPVGAIVPSMLRPTEFAKSVGDHKPGVAPKFVLADGRAVPNSAYAVLLSDPLASVPDLRAMFLRGMSEGREGEYADPDRMRKAGVPQLCATSRPAIPFKTESTGQHDHPFVWNNTDVKGIGARTSAQSYVGNGGTQDRTAVQPGGMHAHTVTEGGDFETRPNNVAVYYYIKIN